VSTSEILEQGPRRPLPRWIIGVGVLLALGVGLFGWRALVDEASAPRELSVVAVSVAEITSIDPNAAGSGWPIKVGMPADGRIPAATLTVTINGDARRDVEIVPASSGGALSIEPTKPRVIAAGTTTDIAVTIAPLDCAVNSTTLDEAGYRWRRAAGVNLVDEIAGATLPLTETAREQLADILLGLCSAAPQPPTISMARKATHLQSLPADGACESFWRRLPGIGAANIEAVLIWELRIIVTWNSEKAL